ncbi:MAG: type II secretion system F family protein [Phycisphaerae bacterium]|nr:type II secretion system F family protein [Phycisphaerae bacterium]
MGARSRLAQTYYDMATLLEAGVPILRSLDILIEGRQGALKHTFAQVRESVSKGSSLSESVDMHPRIFREMDRMLIQAGETSGSLDDSFKMLSQWHEFVHKITWRVLSGLAYPVFCVHAAAFLLPALALVLGKISFGGYFVRVLQILSLLYVPVAIVIATMYFGPRASSLRRSFDWLVLKIPVFGQAVYHLCVSRYAKAFGMLYKAGVPITECTERANRVTGNMIVAGLFAGATISVREGSMASNGFSPRLPAEYRDLWRIGEETGELDKMAAKVAEISADRADLFFTAFASGFPKVVYFTIMIFMAIMVIYMWSHMYDNLLEGF